MIELHESLQLNGKLQKVRTLQFVFTEQCFDANKLEKLQMLTCMDLMLFALLLFLDAQRNVR